jgi:undecaprenyl-diphosphatase
MAGKNTFYKTLLGTIFFLVFVFFSFVVKKDMLKNLDFDTTVKLQDHISRKLDTPLSYFSLLGSAEVTTSVLIGLIILIIFTKRKFFLGSVMFFVATFIEIVGKNYIVHPSPPFFLLRYDLGFSFPSFYVHTNYSYPSGHMTRTAFLLLVILVLIYESKKKMLWKYFSYFLILTFASLMYISRIYLGEHWFSDVFGGLLLGVSTAFFGLVLL